MQDNTEQEKAKGIPPIYKKHMLPAGICCAFFLVAIIAGLILYRNLPTCHWRECHTDFPWKGQGITVSELVSHWQNSNGDERMKLRAAYYPCTKILLGKEVTGKGFLIVRFFDETDTQCSESFYLPYNNGGFEYKEDTAVTANGKEATVRSENGFRVAEDFFRHALMEERPLWKVGVWNRAEGAGEDEYMGYVTIKATDQAK